MTGADRILEVIEPSEAAADIGGLDNLEVWLGKRRNACGREAREFGLPSPKGVLILGIPGTGKSLTAKAAASILRWPILRRAIATAEPISPSGVRRT